MARLFNGTNQTLSCTGNTAMQIPFPISFGFWLWQNAAPGAFRYYMSKVRLAGNHASFGWGTDSGQVMRPYIGTGGSAGNFTGGNAIDQAAGIWNGAWHHYMATYDGTTLRTYFDGALYSGGIPLSSAISYSTDGLYIGSFDGTQLWAAGTMAEACVYSVALTDDEIAAMYRGATPLGVRPANLEMYWPLHGRHSPEHDWMGVAPMTVTGATVADHPRVYMPAPSSIRSEPAAAATSVDAECATASGSAGTPTVATATAGTAEAATSSGSADQVTVAVAPAIVEAGAVGAAHGPQIAAAPGGVETASASGAALDASATAAAAASAECATASGSAETPAPSATTPADVATATGAAEQPPRFTVSAGVDVATAGGTAETPTAATAATGSAETAEAAAAAADGHISTAVMVGAATAGGAGAAFDTATTTSTVAATATADSVAEDPLAVTGSFYLVSAESAEASAGAGNPAGTVTSGAECATVGGAALAGGVTLEVSAGVAAANGAALDGLVDTAGQTGAFPGSAEASGVAENPTVDVTAAGQATADTATATCGAPDPVTAVAAAVDAALAEAHANDPTLAFPPADVDVHADVATASGTAWPAAGSHAEAPGELHAYTVAPDLRPSTVDTGVRDPTVGEPTHAATTTGPGLIATTTP